MEKKFDKNKYGQRLLTTIITCGIILAFGLLSLLLGSTLKPFNADKLFDTKDYYGVYTGKDANNYPAKLTITKDGAVFEHGETVEYVYEFVSKNNMKKQHEIDEDCNGLWLHKEETPNRGLLFCLYKNDGKYRLVEPNSGLELTVEEKNAPEEENSPVVKSKPYHGIYSGYNYENTKMTVIISEQTVELIYGNASSGTKYSYSFFSKEKLTQAYGTKIDFSLIVLQENGEDYYSFSFYDNTDPYYLTDYSGIRLNMIK